MTKNLNKLFEKMQICFCRCRDYSRTSFLDAETADARRHDEDDDDEVELDAVDGTDDQQPESGHQQQEQAAQLEPVSGFHLWHQEATFFH